MEYESIEERRGDERKRKREKIEHKSKLVFTEENKETKKNLKI